MPEATQGHLDPCSDLLEGEGLDDVVVTAGGEAAHLVLRRLAGREEQDRSVIAGRAQSAEHLDAVDVGETDVEDDHVRREAIRLGEGIAPRCSDAHVESLEPERRRHQERDVLLVVDDERTGACHAPILARVAGGILTWTWRFPGCDLQQISR